MGRAVSVQSIMFQNDHLRPWSRLSLCSQVTENLTAKREKDHVGQRVVGGPQLPVRPVDGGTPSSTSGSDSPSRNQLHGDGGGRRGMVPGTTRPPHSAMLYIETTGGIRSDGQLLPLLFGQFSVPFQKLLLTIANQGWSRELYWSGCDKVAIFALCDSLAAKYFGHAQGR